MKNQIEIVKDIADGMYGIGGIPNNEEFYAEFDTRVKAALGIADVDGNEVALRNAAQKIVDITNNRQPEKYYDAFIELQEALKQ